jgi:hypothetical protein
LEQRGKKSELGFFQGPLYGAGARLVTPPSEEGSTATRRRGSRRRVVLHVHEGDENDFLSDILNEQVSWAGLGCSAGYCWDALMGCSVGCCGR